MRGLSLRQAFDEHVARPMSAGELLGSPPPRPRLYGLGLLCSSREGECKKHRDRRRLGLLNGGTSMWYFT